MVYTRKFYDFLEKLALSYKVRKGRGKRNTKPAAVEKADVFSPRSAAPDAKRAIDGAVEEAKEKSPAPDRRTLKDKVDWRDDPNKDLMFDLLNPQFIRPKQDVRQFNLPDRPPVQLLNANAFVNQSSFASVAPNPGPAVSPPYIERIGSWALSQPANALYKTPEPVPPQWYPGPDDFLTGESPGLDAYARLDTNYPSMYVTRSSQTGNV
jgi:hypothetical protein